VLLDALEALSAHRESVVLIGAQAIYLHTGEAAVALPAATKDSDFVIHPRTLGQRPLIEEAMRAAGFELHTERPQPGSWLGAAGIAVDLMVPEALAGEGGTRGVRVPPHWNHAMRRAAGLEAALLDRRKMRVSSLDVADARTFEAWVAGPAALLVSKLHKLAEREAQPNRLVDKDAHDIYRLLVGIQTRELAETFAWLKTDPLAGTATRTGLKHLERLFASGPAALGSMMAGRAEKDIGAPDVVSAAVAALAADLLAALVRG
jgi:hypothetical protein